MAFVAESGRFKIAYQYADALIAAENVADRRPAVIRAHFGDAHVDYSSPK